MTPQERNLILQACAFAEAFIKQADRAVLHQPSEIHEAAAQLGAAVSALPPAIVGCACRCSEFTSTTHPEVRATLAQLPSQQERSR